MSDGWGTPVTPGDALRQLQRKVMRHERRAGVRSLDGVLGAGMAAVAVQIIDWNATDTLLNGFYYSAPGSVNSPNSTLSWTGQTIAKDDGTGMQQVWNTDGPSTLYWMRTYVPTPEEDGNVIFGDWKKFATPSGYIDTGELSDGVNDSISTALANAQAALDAAEEAMDFATTASRVFRQPDEPTALSVGSPLQDGWVWYDTDNGNAIFIYEDSTNTWEPADNAMLAALEADLAAAAAAADAAQADASQAILDAAAAQADADTAATNAGNALTAAAAAQSDADAAATAAAAAQSDASAAVTDAAAALAKFPVTSPDLADDAVTTTKIADDAITTPLLSANAITAKHTITGATVQTEATAARGIKINSGGLTAYNSSGTPTLTITASTGAIAMLGALTSGSTVTGATVTGGVVQTESTAARGVKINSTGLTAYNSTGTPTFTITASTGAVAMLGALTAGSTVTGATVTGGTVQTEATAARGIKMTSGGLIGYDAAGATKFTLTTTGALTVDGPVMSGGTITGAVLQTDAAASTGIKITTSGGVVGYGGGVAKFTLSPTGSLTVADGVYTGGAIDGATVTGGTVQTEVTAARGIKMSSTGLTAYDGAGSPTFTITAATGAVAMLGALTAGSTISGATITGGLFRTASTGQRVELSNNAGVDDLRFYSGNAFETIHGYAGSNFSTYSSGPNYVTEGTLELYSPEMSGYGQARLKLSSNRISTLPGGPPLGGTTTAYLYADNVTITGDLNLNGKLTNGFQVGDNANRTTIIHSASIELPTTNGSGVSTWTHNLALGSLVYQVLITSRNNGAQRVFTVTSKDPNSVTVRVENASGATVNNASNITCDILIIG